MGQKKLKRLQTGPDTIRIKNKIKRKKVKIIGKNT